MNPSLFGYSAFGLRLASNRRLHGLTSTECGHKAAPDLQIDFLDSGDQVKRDPAGETLWYTTDILDENGDPALKIWRGNSSGKHFIRYTNGLTFCLDPKISHVLVSRRQEISDAEICAFLLGPVMGIALRMRGTICLHASAVEIQGKAIAFAGPMGAGKSTTAAIFAQNGHAVLTDDIVALEKSAIGFLAHPGYPLLNLLPDSMALVFQIQDTTQPSGPYVEKVQVRLNGKNLQFQSRPLPLGAIYILEQSENQTAPPLIVPIRPQETLIALASETYANKMLVQEMRAREFQVLGELVNTTPVRRFIVPRDSNIQRLYDILSEDAAVAIPSQPGSSIQQA